MKAITLLLCILIAGVHSKQSKCQQACNQVQSCLDNCHKQRYQTLQTVITITVSCIMVSLLFCACCFLCSHHKFRKLRLLVDRDYHQLRVKYNQPSTETISRTQFKQHLNFILLLFSYSPRKENFVSKWKGEKNIEKINILAKFKQQNLYDIELKGNDDHGHWSASGSIVGTREGVICWFLKEYDFDFTNRMKQKLMKLLYVSSPSDLKYINGTITRFDKHDDDEDQKGQWQLTLPEREDEQYGQSNLQLVGGSSKPQFIQQ